MSLPSKASRACWSEFNAVSLGKLLSVFPRLENVGRAERTRRTYSKNRDFVNVLATAHLGNVNSLVSGQLFISLDS